MGVNIEITRNKMSLFFNLNFLIFLEANVYDERIRIDTMAKIPMYARKTL